MPTNPDFNVLIVAAGTGARFESEIPKQYHMLNGQTILTHTLNIFLAIKGVKNICVVINPAHEKLYKDAIKGLNGISHCFGSEERKDSVYNGLKSFSNLISEDIILIHDAARPCVRSTEINALLHAMQTHEAATLACPVIDTLHYADSSAQSPTRKNLWAIQTPQAFQYGVICNAHKQCNKSKSYTDDTALVSEQEIPIKFIKGSRENFKITYSGDVELAEKILSPQFMTETRTGLGYDVHAFDDDIENITSIKLCGVDIAHNRKLKGHSDADVGLHALTDAILGAIGEGDIGLHFPPSNNDYRDLDSAIFLKHAMDLLTQKNGTLINADITLVCEDPKIGKYRSEIISRIADILNVSKNRINIKATTTEQLGFTGRNEGIAAQASVSITLPIRE